MTTAGGLVAFESHNGDMLLFTKPGGGPLWQIPVGGGAETKILENVVDRSFMPAEDGIYFAQRTDQGHSLSFVSVLQLRHRAGTGIRLDATRDRKRCDCIAGPPVVRVCAAGPRR